MRLGYLVSQYPASSHTFIRREIDALRARGIEIDIFSIRKPAAGELVAQADRAAFDETFYVLSAPAAKFITAHLAWMFCHPVRYFSVLKLSLGHRAPGLRAFIWALFHFAESVVLASELRRRGIGHLHNHFANAAANVGLLTTRLLGLPWSLTLHGISETDYPAGLLLAEKIAAADFVACVSWFGRAQAMRLTPVAHWHKFSIVRCGLNLAELPPVRSTPMSDTAGLRRIICVGRLSSEKGHPGLIEAFAGLHADNPGLELVLVGDGPERAVLEQQIGTLGIGHAVAFKGRLDEQATLAEIAAADLLVLPSFMEGLPVVLMEAMALGVPVVAAHVAGIPELVGDEREGLLFTPADWSDLSEKMARMLGDSGFRERAVSAGRAKIAEEFEISTAVEPLIARFRMAAQDRALR